MLDLPNHVNWLGIGVAAVTAYGLGAIWYLLLFKRTYIVALGREEAPPPPRSALPIVGPFVCQSVMIITSAMLLQALGVTSYAGAAEFGLIVGIGYMVPVIANIAINPNFPRPFLYTLMNAPFFVLASLMSCVILTAMR